jgi:hypothetical protein
VNIYTKDVKQRDKEWYKLMGTTIGGSEIAAIMGLSPYSSFYKVVESKIEICKGLKPTNMSDNLLPCWWGTLFENVISKVVEIDLGNKVKGSNICIQKYEGHRNSPDGYMVVHFYKKDDVYHLWTTDLPRDSIELSCIVLLEFKCPITRKATGNIPKHYIPQVLSGLSVSPIAYKGLYIDAIFKKCSLEQLKNNTEYDEIFHKKTNKDVNLYPITYGVINIYVSLQKITDKIIAIYEEYFDMSFETDDFNIIDLGDVPYDLFYRIIELINDYQLIVSKSTVKFLDGRGDNDVLNLTNKNNCKLFAILPWKLFDLTYILINKEVNFLENVYPTIQKVHDIVHRSITTDCSLTELRTLQMCDNIFN